MKYQAIFLPAKIQESFKHLNFKEYSYLDGGMWFAFNFVIKAVTPVILGIDFETAERGTVLTTERIHNNGQYGGWSGDNMCWHPGCGGGFGYQFSNGKLSPNKGGSKLDGTCIECYIKTLVVKSDTPSDFEELILEMLLKNLKDCTVVTVSEILTVLEKSTELRKANLQDLAKLHNNHELVLSKGVEKLNTEFLQKVKEKSKQSASEQQ